MSRSRSRDHTVAKMAKIQNERHFISKGQTETATLKYEIQDFIHLAQACQDLLPFTDLEIDAGHEIGVCSRWCFHLNNRTTDRKLRLDLKLLKSSTPSLLAYFEWEIKKRDGHSYLGFETTQPGWKQFKVGDSVYSDFGRSQNPYMRMWNDLGDILTNGTLIIEIRFSLMTPNSLKPEEIETCTSMRLVHEGRMGVIEDLQKLLDSEENADVTIEMEDGKKIMAHQTILAARSPVFFAMFQTNMTESSTGIISISDLSYEAMCIVLNFIYSGSLKDKWVEFLDEIVYAAEKYLLPQLKNICDQTMANACNCNAVNAMNLWKLARRYNLKVAEKKLFAFIAENLEQTLDKHV